MKKKIILSTILLVLLFGCSRRGRVDKVDQGQQASVEEIISKVNEEYLKMEDFFYTKYLDEELTDQVGIDHLGYMMASFENGLAVYHEDMLTPKYQLIDKDFSKDGNLTGDFTTFLNFDGKFNDFTIENAKEELKPVINLFTQIDTSKYEFEKFDTEGQNKVNYVAEVDDIVNVNGIDYDLKNLQYYYAEDDETFGLMIKYLVDGVMVQENHFLTMNSDVDFSILAKY